MSDIAFWSYSSSSSLSPSQIHFSILNPSNFVSLFILLKNPSSPVNASYILCGMRSTRVCAPTARNHTFKRKQTLFLGSHQLLIIPQIGVGLSHQCLLCWKFLWLEFTRCFHRLWFSLRFPWGRRLEADFWPQLGHHTTLHPNQLWCKLPSAFITWYKSQNNTTNPSYSGESLATRSAIFINTTRQPLQTRIFIQVNCGLLRGPAQFVQKYHQEVESWFSVRKGYLEQVHFSFMSLLTLGKKYSWLQLICICGFFVWNVTACFIGRWKQRNRKKRNHSKGRCRIKGPAKAPHLSRTWPSSGCVTSCWDMSCYTAQLSLSFNTRKRQWW
jgi:hypothetical protein